MTLNKIEEEIISDVTITVPLFFWWLIISCVQIWWSRKPVNISFKEYEDMCVRLQDNQRKFSPVGRPRKLLAFLSALIEVAQLSSFAFSNSLPWSNNQYFVSLPEIMQSFLFKYGGDSFRKVFWIIVGVVFLGYWFVDLVLGCIQRISKVDDTLKAELYFTWYRTLCISIYVILYASLDCDYLKKSVPYLKINSKIRCWHGLHFAFVVVSLLTLVAYDAIIFSIQRQNKLMAKTMSNAIYYDSLYLALDFRAKVLMIGMLTFYSSFPGVVITVLFLGNIFLVGLQFWIRPCNYEIINIIRLCGFIWVLWSCVSGTVALLIDNNSSWIPFFFFVIGSASLIPLSVVYYKYTSSRFKQKYPDFSLLVNERYLEDEVWV